MCWSHVVVAWSLILLASLLTTTSTAEEQFGHFKGTPVASFLPDGRNLKLERPFGYVDPKGNPWDVPAGTVTDGASVPRVFWITHPPFTGKYRSAAIVHDYYCQKQTRSWRETHLMFYSAMRAGGVVEQTAKVMYAAVYTFGPRWGSGAQKRGPFEMKYQTVEEQQQFMREIELWIARANPNPEDIAKAMDMGVIPS